MTRQLVDLINDIDFDRITLHHDAARLVAALLSEPAEHTIVCPTCEMWGAEYREWRAAQGTPCFDCDNTCRQTVIVRAEVKR